MSLYSSHKFLEQKRKRRKIKLVLFSVLFVLLLIGFVYWAKYPKFNIAKISIIKNTFSKTEKLEASVTKALDGNMLFLIPKTNSLLLPRKDTERKIKEEYPEIENININLKNLDEIEVEIKEYAPMIIWSKDSKRYFVNKEGNIFMEEPVLHSFDNLPVVEDAGDIFGIGSNVIDAVFLESILDFLDGLSQIDLKINKIRIPDKEVLYLETEKGFKILISKKDDLKLVLDNIKTIIEDGGLDKDNLDLIDYVDLRFGNKVFYKLK